MATISNTTRAAMFAREPALARQFLAYAMDEIAARNDHAGYEFGMLVQASEESIAKAADTILRWARRGLGHGKLLDTFLHRVQTEGAFAPAAAGAAPTEAKRSAVDYEAEIHQLRASLKEAREMQAKAETRMRNAEHAVLEYGTRIRAADGITARLQRAEYRCAELEAETRDQNQRLEAALRECRSLTERLLAANAPPRAAADAPAGAGDRRFATRELVNAHFAVNPAHVGDALYRMADVATEGKAGLGLGDIPHIEHSQTHSRMLAEFMDHVYASPQRAAWLESYLKERTMGRRA